MPRTITLSDSRGEYVAFLHDETLFDRAGERLGVAISRFGIIVDMEGGYLGEVGPGNRLVRRCGRGAAPVGQLVRGAADGTRYEDVPLDAIRPALSAAA